MVHVIASNFKATAATYHEASCRYAQEYRDKFSYLLNRRFWGGINFLTTTPLKICIGHPPVSATYGNFMPCKLLMTNNL